jgi:hypothetical protein
VVNRGSLERHALATRALTEPLLHNATHGRSRGPSLTGGSAVRSAQPALRPPPTPTRHATHFPGSPVTGHASSRNTYPQVPGPGRASPVPAATFSTFRTPYAEESLRAAPPGSSPLPWPPPRFRGLGTPASSVLRLVPGDALPSVRRVQDDVPEVLHTAQIDAPSQGLFVRQARRFPQRR